MRNTLTIFRRELGSYFNSPVGYIVITAFLVGIAYLWIEVGQVFAQARELGTPWLIFEQDRYPVSPLASCQVCAERCAQAL